MLILLFSCQQPTPEVSSDKLFSLLPPSYTGIEFQNPVVETATENHIINDMLISGAGVAVADINNDGLSDLYFTGNQVPDRLYLNKGNLQFEDITKKAGIEVINAVDKSTPTDIRVRPFTGVTANRTPIPTIRRDFINTVAGIH